MYNKNSRINGAVPDSIAGERRNKHVAAETPA